MRASIFRRPLADTTRGRERNLRCRILPRAIHVVVGALAFLRLISPAEAREIDWAAVEQEAAQFLRDYIQIDTSNPPGNEIAAAGFLAERFRREQIETRVFESEEKRGSVMARLPGREEGGAIVLLSHLDVVPAAAQDWKHPPFAGAIEAGYVHGRGALDSKGLSVIEAMTLIVMKRAGIRPSREVVFLATADEEAGGALGAGWLVKNQSEALGQPAFVLNEGGAIRVRPDGTRIYEVAVAEKTPLWLRLTTTGEAGHGSTPRGRSSVGRLIRALERIRKFRAPIQVVPDVEAYYRARSAMYDEPRRSRWANLRASLQDAAFRQEFLRDPNDAALVRNTISITVLRGSDKTNVIPQRASAELDCRLLPGEDPARFVETLTNIVDDDAIEFTILLNFPSSSSPSDTPLYRAIETLAASEGSRVVPTVLRGFTDSHYFRELRVPSYGFLPVALDEEDERGMHGVNERFSLENLREGTRRLVEILNRIGPLGQAATP